MIWTDLFQSRNRSSTEHSRRTYARFELLRTGVEFAAAVCFLIGSVLFLREDLRTPATWLFIAGSLLFCARPTIKMWSEIVLYRMGKIETLAERSAPSEAERRRMRQADEGSAEGR